MSHEAALLAAIRERPEDDAPRLIYADWLDEQGGESNTARAEYIRLEIEYAQAFPEKRLSKAKQEAQKRARTLFAKHYREWFPELFGRKNILRGARGSPDMRRGFPYRLLAQAEKLLQIGERLMALAPITEVEFRDMTTSTVERFVKAPWVRGFHKLNLTGYDTPPTDWAPLADCPYLTEVLELCPYSGQLDSVGAARIAAANPFPKLQRCSVGFRLSDDVLAALFGGTAFTGLRELRLSSSHDQYGLPGLQAIAGSRALASLKSFDLPWRPIPGMIGALIRATFWPGLKELKLLRNDLNDGDLTEIIRHPAKLHTLDLDDNKITAVGARLLAESPMLASITHLNLSRNKIGDVGITALVNSPHARHLQALKVSSCRFGLAGVTALANSPHLANLRELVIYSNEIDIKGAKVLAASPHLGGLTSFWPGGSLTTAARKHLKARFGDAVSF